MIKISIITVVKNGLPYLKSAIQAVKEQKNYQKKEIEHVVVCSPSNDGTEDYLANVNNIKLILDRQSNNKFGSLNIGIQNCSGSIIGILHADDIFYENDTLQKVLSNFNEHTDVVYGNILFSAKNDLTKITREWISSPFNKTKLSLGWMPPHTSIFVKKKILERNLYKTNYPISGDYYFILKLFHNKNIKTNCFQCLDEVDNDCLNKAEKRCERFGRKLKNTELCYPVYKDGKPTYGNLTRGVCENEPLITIPYKVN